MARDTSITAFRFNVVPLKDGGKQINIMEGIDEENRSVETMTRIPFSEEAVEILIDDMSTPSDELAERIDKQEAEAAAEAAKQQ